MEGNSMKNNKGFTLVELVVVIALMGIIAGVSSTVISSVSKQELKDFTNNLDAMLCQTKIETMSGMPDPMLELAIIDGEYRATLYKNSSSTTPIRVKSQYLGEDYLYCRYYKGDEDTNGEPYHEAIMFKYDRNTGELSISNSEITKLSVAMSEKGEKGQYVIQFVPQTGYHKIVN